MNDFTLYAYTFRSRAERVLWTLRELNFPYKVIRLNPFNGENKTPEFIRLNPLKKIPVLIHNDKILTESLAIMEYLNDISGSHNLIPSEPDLSYKFRKNIHYGLTEIEPYLWIAEKASHLKKNSGWPEGTYEEAIRQIIENIGLVWQWLLVENYICGNEFSLADIYYYHLITWAKQHNIDYSTQVADYLKRSEKRPSFPEEMLSK